MKRKLILGMGMVLFLVNIVNIIPAFAKPIAGSGTVTYSYPQYSPPDFGPYQYYGIEVCLEYTITIHWSSITYPKGDVRQTLTARGTVNIYEYDETDPDNSIFIETRRCSASLSFYDATGDACIGEPGGFYEVDWLSLEKMERLHHLHQVTGVYVRRTWVRNGDGAGKAIAFTHPPTVLIVNE